MIVFYLHFNDTLQKRKSFIRWGVGQREKEREGKETKTKHVFLLHTHKLVQCHLVFIHQKPMEFYHASVSNSLLFDICLVFFPHFRWVSNVCWKQGQSIVYFDKHSYDDTSFFLKKNRLKSPWTWGEYDVDNKELH